MPQQKISVSGVSASELWMASDKIVVTLAYFGEPLLDLFVQLFGDFRVLLRILLMFSLGDPSFDFSIGRLTCLSDFLKLCFESSLRVFARDAAGLRRVMP